MKIAARFRRWLRRRQREQVAKRRKAALREFVYLDEVSVYSLLASRLGPIAAEFTETQTASLQSEIGSSLHAGAGIAKAEVDSRVLSRQSQGTQVLRKSIVQTTFKELYELEAKSLAMRPMPDELEPPDIGSLKELVPVEEVLAADGWIVDPETLGRGKLVELEVRLEAEAIFRVSAVTSTILEILEQNRDILGVDNLDELIQMKSVNRILEELLVGLVPIRGLAADYGVVELQDKEWIVHRELLNRLPPEDPPLVRPLYVVGVAEQSLFWKDIRRVLFSNADFRVLTRISQNGLQDSWTPVKLADVLGSVMPSLADRIDAVGSEAIESMIEASKSGRSLQRSQQRMRRALFVYAELLAEHYGYHIARQDLSQAGLPSAQHCASSDTVSGRRRAFDAIAAFVLDRFDLEREPLVVARYRDVALRDVGIGLSGQATSVMSSEDSAPSPSRDERFLDSEFVAIYW